MVKGEDNNFGLASVIFGIISITLSVTFLFLGSFAGVAFGILGLVFGLIQRKKSKNKWTFWGILLSIVGLAVSLILAVLFISYLVELLRQLQELQASGALEAGLIK